MADVIITGALAVIVFLIVRGMVRRRGRGDCPGGCSGCSGSGCPGCGGRK
ncbi:MAG: FeoB-associated Cys-rich membrane protein [Lachnospiraceae bacterium]|nr:FeoB-associated Cys-rich membrane protein [Lachnospiraceae bacterium]